MGKLLKGHTIYKVYFSTMEIMAMFNPSQYHTYIYELRTIYLEIFMKKVSQISFSNIYLQIFLKILN